MSLTVHRTFRTEAPTTEAFAFLADFRNTEVWDPGTVSCDLLSDDVGPGAVYRNVSKFLGRTTELTYATLLYLPTTELLFQGRNDAFVGDDHFTFQVDGTGTRIDYRAEFRLQGASRLATPVVAAYLPVLANKTIKQLRAALDGLPARS